MIILTIHLSISLGTLLARENIEGTVWFFFQIRYADVEEVPWFIYCLFEMCIIPWLMILAFFGIHKAIFKLKPSNCVHFEILSGCLT